MDIKRIKMKMVEKGVNQGDLARYLGITESEISRKFTNNIPFTLGQLRKIKRLFVFTPTEMWDIFIDK